VVVQSHDLLTAYKICGCSESRFDDGIQNLVVNLCGWYDNIKNNGSWYSGEQTAAGGTDSGMI
jgi:hypothetical protein